MKTALLNDFFTKEEYPTKNDGRVSLIIEADGPNTKADFRAILFTGIRDGRCLGEQRHIRLCIEFILLNKKSFPI